MGFEVIKALHLIFIITWFAGLFYIVRLFIYQTEALARPEAERKILAPQLALMASRLWYIITWPSAILTLIFGYWVLSFRWGYLQEEFMWVKLALVGLLYLYHGCNHVLFMQLQKGIARWNSTQLRIWNELATLLLFAIVFLIVLKNTLHMAWGIVALIGLGLVLMLGIRVYKKIRNQ